VLGYHEHEVAWQLTGSRMWAKPVFYENSVATVDVVFTGDLLNAAPGKPGTSVDGAFNLYTAGDVPAGVRRAWRPNGCKSYDDDNLRPRAGDPVLLEGARPRWLLVRLREEPERDVTREGRLAVPRCRPVAGRPLRRRVPDMTADEQPPRYRDYLKGPVRSEPVPERVPDPHHRSTIYIVLDDEPAVAEQFGVLAEFEGTRAEAVEWALGRPDVERILVYSEETRDLEPLERPEP
jgi:hypothetical protein